MSSIQDERPQCDTPIPSGLPRLRTRKQFITLALVNLVFGAAIFSTGIVAFVFTPDYRTGSFWTAFLLLISFAYNTGWLAARLLWNDNSFIRKHNRKLGAISAVISAVAFTGCLVAAIVDFVAYYLLTNTNFSQCEYTNVTTVASCSSLLCPTLDLQPKTCYCCYLYDDRSAGGCESRFLLTKQTVFREVNSCEAISTVLQPTLGALSAMNIGAALTCIVYFFQTSPLRYLIKNAMTKTEQERNQVTTGEATPKGLPNKVKMCLCNMFCHERVRQQTNISRPDNFTDDI